MPTAPWMTGPLLLPPDHVLDFSQKQKPKQKQKRGEGDASSLTATVHGGRSRHAMRGIVRSIRSLGDAAPAAAEAGDEVAAPERPPRPWAGAGEETLVFGREKKARAPPTAAERRLPAAELARLRSAARGTERRWVRAKKAGLTPEVVEEIARVWRTRELAAVRIVEPLRRNMDRAREIVEAKTGGLVVCTKRDILVAYKGPGEKLLDDIRDSNCMSPTNYNRNESKKENLEPRGTLYERETNRLLDGLGPRFIDWWWKKPLPVDADLLPEVVPDFRTLFRQCPPGVRPQLRDNELTYLRMLARPLPTHFALGKNKGLEGLAAAILKLWEKSLVAKIAVKVGIPDTNNELMACELKRLTGGVLILRNKFFIILYRGKDFLPGRVADSIIERETVLYDQQLAEEEARSKAAATFQLVDGLLSNPCSIGTFREYQEIQVNHIDRKTELCEAKLKLEAEKVRLEKEIKEQERQLFNLTRKIEKSEKVLANLNSSRSSSDQTSDQELLTEEERQTFRTIGLKMDEHLLLGRRGIYDGVIGNIHQHWKHREVVKVITMQKGIQQIRYTASQLEIESGGTLIAVEKLRSSNAIIIYRGKNYRRPLKLLPDNLLTKKEALERSIEVQRRGSLKFFARQREESIWDLKRRLRDLEEEIREITPGKSAHPR
ncbi:chloroplastic group IIA intron splicing facilitator CRS1, chloroplastic [Ananas comosus]|uniref:Chloroplastic group IIA intron splicing facilitator CRS1, chloroplastic n=1 Tax=Ananas comosus TaxID=4615 RepID=A0A6P5FN44_ANACO|nr:chloroplastic group IIA intron splicing facilitator CRS1, chloroplastic [Ananas comosus]